MIVGNAKPPEGARAESVTAEEDMAAFDRLPFIVREALRIVPVEVTAPSAARLLDGGLSPEQVAVFILRAAWDAVAVEAQENARG